ncbi:hypothetical protein F2Q70_00043710 [Brassica cretica]|uniref:Uncharacterized protein n=1 Tax=Brassica cretica TaxID=69181 RepID=A0A3N6PZ11_BRACR|nr:hypothetical protein F2Q70_00043710 [Brassica cretica]KAF3515880.1 hypothetical protein DY000_02061030 [Brassica cretica]
MVRRRKQQKKYLIWNINDVLLILKGIQIQFRLGYLLWLYQGLDKHTLLQKATHGRDCATIIWAKNETEDASSENRQDQAKSVGKTKQKMLFQDLKTLGAQRRKELAGEWKALLNEEMELHMKKLTLLTKASL